MWHAKSESIRSSHVQFEESKASDATYFLLKFKKVAEVQLEGKRRAQALIR